MWLFRFLLLFYPREFRSDRRLELKAVYRQCFEAERNRRGRSAALLLALVDVIRAGWVLRRPRAGARRASLSRGLADDVRLAARALGRAPLSLAGLVIVLALGIGANGAVFSLVEAVLLKPLPYAEPDRIVIVQDALGPPRIPDVISRGTVSERVLNWRERYPGALSDLAVFKTWQGNLDARFDLVLEDRAERLRAGLVTPNFFEVLGVGATLGRLFSSTDGRQGAPDLVVLSHGLWRRAFGADPDIVGRTVVFVTGRRERGPRPFTVIGVLPPSFRFTYPVDTELWALHPWKSIEDTEPRAIQYNGAVGRLSPGVSLSAAAARMGASAEPYPLSEDRFTRLLPIAEWVTGEIRTPMLLLAGVALLLLVIACATVANALLVRYSGRRRDLAVRASLGAPRQRLLRQLLAEGVLLSLTGTVAGSLLAVTVLPAFRALVPDVVPRADQMGVDFWIVAFAAAIASTVTLLAAVIPAVQASRVDAAALSRAGGSSSASAAGVRWRFALVAAQAAVSTVLLVGAALLLLSFWRLGRVELGFDAHGIVTVEMRLLDPRYREDGALQTFQDRLLSRVRALPGVIEAGASSAVPFRGVDFFTSYQRPGGGPRLSVNRRTVDPAFFSLLRIPLLAGRLLSDRDGPDAAPVAVVSESFARELFPQGAVGQTIEVGRTTRRIVGVVADVRYQSHQVPPRAALYLPADQWPVELICLLVRTAPGVDRIGTALRSAIREVDPALPAMKMATVDGIISESISDRRFYTVTTVSYALLALLLSSVGLIVVVSRSAVERRREMAIRAALGAGVPHLIGLLSRQGLAPVVLGVVFGVAAASLGVTVLQRFLFEVSPVEPAVYVAVAAATLLVSGLACLIPARHLPARTLAPLLRGGNSC